VSSLSTGALIVIFIACAIAIWMAGVRLASATDELDDHFGLGEALGGMILLSIVGSLPSLPSRSRPPWAATSASPPAISSGASPCRPSCW
jgi:hypothetical protein